MNKAITEEIEIDENGQEVMHAWEWRDRKRKEMEDKEESLAAFKRLIAK